MKCPKCGTEMAGKTALVVVEWTCPKCGKKVRD